MVLGVWVEAKEKYMVFEYLSDWDRHKYLTFLKKYYDNYKTACTFILIQYLQYKK